MHPKETSICVFTNHSTIGFRSVMKGIVYAARERGWAVRTIELDHTTASVHELLREWHPTGFLSYCLTPNLFPKRSVCVHINPKNTNGDAWTVRHDSRITGDLAAHELLKLAGRSYAFVGDPANAPWSRIRGEHFMKTVSRFGFKCSVCDVVRPENNPVLEQANLTQWIKGLSLPCAIFAANDKSAESVLAAALSAGLQVPDDLAVLGVDNDEDRCENAPVTLSSVIPDFFRGGLLGCALLARRISNPKPAPRSATYYGDLGVATRSSTRLQLKPNSLVAQMREFIRIRASAGISAADVVRETGRRRRGVELAFRAATGKTIGEEIQDVRIELAQCALADESIQIGEIPSIVGLASQNQLERLFKRTHGVTMRDYRKNRLAPLAGPTAAPRG